jgi:hypothetical protein
LTAGPAQQAATTPVQSQAPEAIAAAAKTTPVLASTNTPNITLPLDANPDAYALPEADLSVLGFFRLETRSAAQGLNVVIRHAEPFNAAGLEALDAAAEAEAQRFGVQPPVKFRHEPELERR